MELTELCREIALPESLAEKVLLFSDKRGFADFRKEIDGMKSPERGERAVKDLQEKCSENIGVLACSLQCAAETAEEYLKRGIPKFVFLDTMKCFSRFLAERFRITGEYVFDRAWWTWRQLSLRLFRLGELEYEYADGGIEIHIPSDARLTDELCECSFRFARSFTEKYFPSYKDARFSCESWLLSPALPKLLGEGSNILRFRERFEIERIMPDDGSFRLFVFGRGDGDVKSYAENTSLQKNMKRYLLGGGKVGAARGYLKNF